MTIELTPKLLRDYFTAHLDEPVGSVACCPIKTVLTSHGVSCDVGTTCWIDFGGGINNYPFEPWQSRFVAMMDWTHRREKPRDQFEGDCVTWESATGAIALAILDKALEATP